MAANVPQEKIECWSKGNGPRKGCPHLVEFGEDCVVLVCNLRLPPHTQEKENLYCTAYECNQNFQVPSRPPAVYQVVFTPEEE